MSVNSGKYGSQVSKIGSILIFEISFAWYVHCQIVTGARAASGRKQRYIQMADREIVTKKYPKVVIVGAGFGGLGAAEQLDHVPVQVTLIDRHNYHTFQPLLYQVATSLLNAEDVGAPVRSIFRHQENANFLLGTVTGINVPEKKIQLDNGQEIA